MKKTLLIILSIGILFSCQSEDHEKTIRDNVSQAIKKNMNDPDSFEFVDMGQLDTITMEIVYDRELAILKIRTSNKDDLLERMERNVETSRELASYGEEFQHYVHEAETQLSDKILEYEKFEREIDSLEDLKKSASKNDINHFVTTVRIRGNNSFGAKILNRYNVILDTDLNVMDISKEE